MKQLIRDFVNVYGPSGNENRVAELAKSLLSSCVDETHTDVMGNLICLKKGRKGGKRIMLSAHMDHIGLMVLDAEDNGYLRVMNVGGVDAEENCLRHVVFGNGVNGVLVMEPLHPGETASIDHLYIDIGVKDKKEALQRVKSGDIAVYANDCFELGQDKLTAPAMDDRVACALLASVMRDLPDDLPNDVYAVFSTQEEVGCRGSATAAFGIMPDIGIALDVTGCGDTPREKFPAVKLGEGACVKIMDRGSISSPEIVNGLIAAAERCGAPYQREVLPYGGTDARSIQLAGSGVKVCTVSIPCRYVHSACETVDVRDVTAAHDLLIEYLAK